MLKPFYNTVDTYLNSLKNVENPVDNVNEIIYKKNNAIKNVNSFEINMSGTLDKLKLN